MKNSKYSKVNYNYVIWQKESFAEIHVVWLEIVNILQNHKEI